MIAIIVVEKFAILVELAATKDHGAIGSFFVPVG